MNLIRLYFDAAGESHFEQVDLNLTLREFAPPAAPLRVSDPQPAQNYVILEVGAEWGGAVPHPSPARMMAGAAPVTSPNDGVQFIRLHSRDGKLG
jgi:hypothetical protein